MFALKPVCIVLIRRMFEAVLRAWLILRQERAFTQLVKWHALCHCIYGFMALFSFPESGIVLLECTTENLTIKVKLEANNSARSVRGALCHVCSASGDYMRRT